MNTIGLMVGKKSLEKDDVQSLAVKYPPAFVEEFNAWCKSRKMTKVGATAIAIRVLMMLPTELRDKIVDEDVSELKRWLIQALRNEAQAAPVAGAAQAEQRHQGRHPAGSGKASGTG